MDTFENDDQQLAALKTFWESYGKPIVTGVVIGAIGLMGWRYYSNHQAAVNANHSLEYQQVVQNLRMNHAKAFGMAEKFVTDNQSNVFGALVGLQLSSEAVSENRMDLAEKTLQSVVDHKADDAVQPLASIRLARVLLENKKADAALKILDQVKDKSYQSQVEEVRGDIYLSQKQTDKARSAYQAAMDANKDSANPVLQMKLDDISSK